MRDLVDVFLEEARQLREKALDSSAKPALAAARGAGAAAREEAQNGEVGAPLLLIGTLLRC